MEGMEGLISIFSLRRRNIFCLDFLGSLYDGFSTEILT
jgi:hypothetical protein